MLIECAVDSRPMMMLSLSRESSLESSNWKPSASFVNMNGGGIILPSEEIAAARRFTFGNINAYKNFHEVVPPFHKV